MSVRCTVGLVLLGACGGEPSKGVPEAGGPGAVDSGEADGADGAAVPGDSGDPGDSGEPEDSGAPSPCTEGLQVELNGVVVDSSGHIPVGEAPSRAWVATAALTLTNLCDDQLRFLGHPDAWVTGEGFRLESLPPVALNPGESAVIELGFEPGAPGEVWGGLSLPHDQVGSPFAVGLSGVATDPLTLVLVGEGRRVSTTHDYGETWTTDTWETLAGHTNAMQRGMCWGADTFVAVGGSDGSYWWTSPDGDTWTAHVDAAGGAVGGCEHGGEQFVAFAGDLWSSTDGRTWTVSPQSYAPDHLRAMAFGMDVIGTGRWVAVGDNGRVAVTLDGSSWAVDANPLSASVRTVAWGDGSAGPVWVAVGTGGLVATSADGETWTEQVVGSGFDHAGVVWGGDRFLVANGAAVYSSADGYGWALENASGVVPLAHLGRMWFGADGAALYRSDDDGFSWVEVRPDDGGPGYSEATFATGVK